MKDSFEFTPGRIRVNKEDIYFKFHKWVNMMMGMPATTVVIQIRQSPFYRNNYILNTICFALCSKLLYEPDCTRFSNSLPHGGNLSFLFWSIIQWNYFVQKIFVLVIPFLQTFVQHVIIYWSWVIFNIFSRFFSVPYTFLSITSLQCTVCSCLSKISSRNSYICNYIAQRYVHTINCI